VLLDKIFNVDNFIIITIVIIIIVNIIVNYYYDIVNHY